MRYMHCQSEDSHATLSLHYNINVDIFCTQGPFITVLDYFGTCKGLKSKNLTFLEITMNELSITNVNITIPVDAKIVQVRFYSHILRLRSVKTIISKRLQKRRASQLTVFMCSRTLF